MECSGGVTPVAVIKGVAYAQNDLFCNDAHIGWEKTLYHILCCQINKEICGFGVILNYCVNLAEPIIRWIIKVAAELDRVRKPVAARKLPSCTQELPQALLGLKHPPLDLPVIFISTEKTNFKGTATLSLSLSLANTRSKTQQNKKEFASSRCPKYFSHSVDETLLVLLMFS